MKRLSFPLAIAAMLGVGGAARAQQYPTPTELPNPYRLVEGWPTLPKSMNGGKWGELIRADIDPKGDIWVFHRCFNTEPAGAATCVGRSEPPILKFDPSGKLLTSFGGGMFAFPHGFTVDAEGNVWASDANASETVLGLSAKGPNGITRGHQVFKFSPTGAVLMTLGKQGVKGSGPDTFDQPTGIAIAPNGDIFVTDGHGKNDRVLKRLKERSPPAGSFHTIFDQDGNFIAAWKQFGRPSAVFVSKDDTLYVSDSHSNSTVNPGYMRGITIGSAKDGSLEAFIPDPDLAQADVNRISGASGIVADDQGTIYAADVGPHKLRKYVKVK